jgi:hypothetical protein
MTNKINYLIKTSQEIVIETHNQLYSSPDDHERKKNLASAVDRIHSLFEKNQETICVSKDLSLEEQAIEYVRNHPILKPFLSQLFPAMQFPKVTQIFAICDTDFGNDLAIRGSIPLSWEKPPESHQEAQLLNAICSAQLEFEKIKTKYQEENQSNDWRAALSELKSRITPLFEDGVHVYALPPSQEHKEQSVDYPIYLSPFVYQLALVVLDQHLKEVENELVKDICDINIDSIKNSLMLSLMLFEVPSIPHLLFDTMERIFNLCSEERRLISIKSLAESISRNINNIDLCIPILKAKNSLFSQDMITEIAKIAATQDAWGVSCRIKNYGLEGYPDRLFEVAKIAAAQNARAVSELIEDYGLNNYPDRLFEIAKIAAAQNGWVVSELIKNYGLEGHPDRLFEIAKIAAAQNGWVVSELIKNYGLEGHSDRLFEIAKIAAAQNAGAVSELIKNYGLEGHSDRLFEIAKIAAAQNAGVVSRCIKNYGLEGHPDHLFEIAKIAATQDAWGVSYYIKNYGLEGHPDHLFEIAKIAAAQNAEAISLYIKNYGLKEPKKLLAIFIITLRQNPEAIAYFARYHLPDDEPLCKAFDLLSKENSDFSEVATALETFAKTQGWDVELLLKEIKELKNAKIQKDLFIWLASFLTSCLLEDLSEEQFNFLVRENFIQSVISLRDPAFRYVLTTDLLQFAKDKKAQKFAAEQINKTKLLSHQRLPLLLICSLHSQGISEQTFKALLEIAYNRNYKDLVALRKLLKPLHAILQASELTSEDKSHLLSVIISQSKKSVLAKGGKKTEEQVDISDFLKKLATVETLLLLKTVKFLKKETLNANGNDLPATLQRILQHYLPIKPIDDFAGRYQKHFAEARLPHYILTYISKIEFLPAEEKKSLMDTLKVCVEAILEGNLKQVRYDMDQSLHLKTVFLNRQDLFEEWKSGASYALDEFLQPSSGQEHGVDFFKILYAKMVTDRHLDPKRVPYLTSFLQLPESRFAIIEEIERKLKSLEQSEEFFMLKIESDCIRLTDPELDLDQKKGILREIKEQLNKVSNIDEFKNDIEALIKGLNAHQAKYDKWTIVDTDDAQDLFLCGTEVGGSCQRIEGDQYLNKCLMSYVIDGKNRLLAVKDASGRIIARHILHILWDATQQQSVLFLERLYPAVVAPELQKALLNLAHLRADKMGLPLLSKECGSGPSYVGSVQSLGSRTPFEYSDAGGGVIANGEYQILKAHQLK